MKVDITSMFFNSSIDGQTATPAWRTSLGQSKTKNCRIETDVPGVIDVVIGMTYKSVSDISKLEMSGISGSLLMCSVFDKVYVNSIYLSGASYVLLLLRETSQSHEGRMQLCYSKHINYDGKKNAETIEQIRDAIGCGVQGCWFVYDISIQNQDELHFSAKVVDSRNPKKYNAGTSSKERSQEWKDMVSSSIYYTIDELATILRELYEEGKKSGEGVANVFFFGLKYAERILGNNYKPKDIIQKSQIGDSFQTELEKAIKLYLLLQRKGWAEVRNIMSDSVATSVDNFSYLPYLTALRTKPFMLLAGISGTGKSRIVRELAKACWAEGEDDYGNNCPRNFCMVQVKPNWHDSSDLIGYVSRINGEKYVVGPFLHFLAKALQDPTRPYFLCLDEMNLAPVEQYFAEYLSVIESRKLQNGQITTDPVVPFENTEAYGSLIDQLFKTDEERKAYKTENGGKRLILPPNLFVVGTVNMDETTFSFSRKVLDRAMTIEMNEVQLDAGLDSGNSAGFGYIGTDLIGDATEGCDIYAENQSLCDEVVAYLGKVNDILEGTPFKIAYRTRNDFLLYAVNRLHFAPESELWQTLDEMTSMKILSRIEGDNECCERVLEEMKSLLVEIVGEHATNSVSLKKINEMQRKLKSGYTSYWT